MRQASLSEDTPAAFSNRSLKMPIEKDQHPTSPVALTSACEDEDLACNALILMANLERLLARLVNPPQPPSAALVLESLTHITNHIVAFAEQLPRAAQHLTLETLIVQDRTNYTQLQSTHISDCRLTIASLVELSADPKVFRGLSNDILRVIHICLNIFAMTFDDTPLKEQWLTLFKGFNADLVKTVIDLQPD